MGGKKGGGQRTPHIAPNNLKANQIAKFVDLVCSGQIKGFENGNEEPLKSTYLENTVIQNLDGSVNFDGVTLEFAEGTYDQNYMPGFAEQSRRVDVGVRVKKATPVSRTITNSQVTSLRVAVGVNSLFHNTLEGDSNPTSVAMNVQLLKSGLIYTTQTVNIHGKSVSRYPEDVVFDDLPEAPFDVRVVRLDNDSESELLRNDTEFYYYIENIDTKMRYSGCVVTGLTVDAEYFGSSVINRNYGIFGSIVQVPSNYNPETREYDGLWDRLFKPAYTDNPAWVLYDLLTNEDEGLGSYFKGFRKDIDTFYEVSKYCDELVDDGDGGKEPRFVCNIALFGEPAYQVVDYVASIFRGAVLRMGDEISLFYDKATDISWVYTNDNVVDGMFGYSYVDSSEEYNQIQAEYLDSKEGYVSKIAQVSDDANIAMYGLKTSSIVAYGSTKYSYAIRTALYNLITSTTEFEKVAFAVGRSGLRHKVYDVFEIADTRFAGTGVGGRIVKSKGYTITTNRNCDGVKSFRIPTISSSKLINVKRQISPFEFELSVEDSISAKFLDTNLAEATYAAHYLNVKPRLFRCLDIKEKDKGIYEITAVSHNPNKSNAVDEGAIWRDEENYTILNPIPSVVGGFPTIDGNSIVLEWETLSVPGSKITYRIKIEKDGKGYASFETKDNFIRLENLEQGEYVARIRAVNEYGQHSEELTIAFSTTYRITGLEYTGIYAGITLKWQLPPLIVNSAVTEIWRAEVDDRSKARLYSKIPYPQNQETYNGFSMNDEFYFWFRIVDDKGNQGEFTHSLLAKPSSEKDVIKSYLEGTITTKELAPEVIGEVVNEAIDEIKTEIDNIVIDSENIKNHIDDVIGESEVIKEVKSKADLNESELKILTLAKSTGDSSLTHMGVLLNAKTDINSTDIKIGALSEATGDRARSAQYLMLNAKADNTEADLLNFKEVVVEDGKATAKSIETLSAKVDDNESSIEKLDEVVTTETQATAKSFDEVKASIDNNDSSIKVLTLARSTADKSHSEQATLINAKSDNALADISALRKTVTTENEATAKDILTLKSDVGKNSSEINTLRQTHATDKTATAKEISELKVTAGKNSAGIVENKTAIANVDGTVRSQYTLATQTTIDGKVYTSGFTSIQNGKSSEFLIQADKLALVNVKNGVTQMPFIISSGTMFFNGDMFATGSIKGDKIVAGTELKSPKIVGGSLNIGNGKVKISEQGVVDIRADVSKNVGMRITNDRIDVYDETGKLRVRMGRLK